MSGNYFQSNYRYTTSKFNTKKVVFINWFEIYSFSFFGVIKLVLYVHISARASTASGNFASTAEVKLNTGKLQNNYKCELKQIKHTEPFFS